MKTTTHTHTTTLTLLLLLAATTTLTTQPTTPTLTLPKTKAPPNAKTYIITPTHGETVPTTFTIKFGLQGMGIAPAGINFPNTGHHHLLINTDKLPDLNKPLPATDNILHYGNGQTQTTLTLPKGTHTLQLILGDYLHIPHDKPIISKKIQITVQ